MSAFSAPRPITPEDDTSGFESSEESLDSYLRHRALRNHQAGASHCYVTCRDGRVVGYHALAAGAVSHRDATGRFRRNRPDPIPVVLVSRLAVDRSHQGQGLGAQLRRDAVLRCVQAADTIGVRAILVHALHDHARAFYERYDFEPSPTDPLHLMLLITDARAAGT